MMINFKKFLPLTLLPILFLPSQNKLEKADNPTIDKLEVLSSEEENLWSGKNFTTEESEVLVFLQKQGITDRAALATILGNIKQESKFVTTVCEGGRNTGYSNCHVGGFGLIQWTHPGRYNGLGSYSSNRGLNPDSLQAQLGWMINEVEWKSVENDLKTPGKSIDQYMWCAKKWLGWGIHGQRTSYANDYYTRLFKSSHA